MGNVAVLGEDGRVLIPGEIRTSLHLQAGECFTVRVADDGVIELRRTPRLTLEDLLAKRVRVHGRVSDEEMKETVAEAACGSFEKSEKR